MIRSKFRAGMIILLEKNPSWSKERAYRRMKELAEREKQGLTVNLEKL